MTCCRCHTPKKPSNCSRARSAKPRMPRHAAAHRERVGVRGFRTLAPARMGISHRSGGPFRLRSAARREQRVRELEESGAGRPRLHRTACPRQASARFILRATPATARCSSTIMDRTYAKKSGSCTATRLHVSAPCPRSSNGTRTSRRSRPWSPRVSAQIGCSGNCVASLRELQASFAAALRDDSAACAVLPRENLAIYRNNAAISFRSALSLSFPVLRRRVGDDYFRQLAMRYRQHHPSRSGDLHWVGQGFRGVSCRRPAGQ